jgi:hypothetical protein
MDSRGFLRLVDEAFTPFLTALGFVAKAPSINGRHFQANFVGDLCDLSISFEPGVDFEAIFIFTERDAGLASIDDPAVTPRLADLNRRYSMSVSDAARRENKTFFSGLRVEDKFERSLLKSAKDLRLVLPLFLSDLAQRKAHR